MDENEVVVLDLQLDSADAEKTLGRLLESAESFKDLFESIGAGMSKMFSALQNSLGKTVTNIDLMTQALGKATEAVEKLVKSFSLEGLAAAGEQALGILGDIRRRFPCCGRFWRRCWVFVLGMRSFIGRWSVTGKSGQ